MPCSVYIVTPYDWDGVWDIPLQQTGNKNTSEDHPNDSTDKNTEKSPWDLRKLAVTQTPVKDHQMILFLFFLILKEVK